MITKGSLSGDRLPGRIVHKDLQAAVDAAAGVPVGLSIAWDENDLPIEIRYECESDQGVDEDLVRRAITSYQLDEDEDDDLQIFEKRAEAGRQASEDVDTRLADFDARLAALEDLMKD